jgi:hypothetical protein
MVKTPYLRRYFSLNRLDKRNYTKNFRPSIFYQNQYSIAYSIWNGNLGLKEKKRKKNVKNKIHSTTAWQNTKRGEQVPLISKDTPPEWK